MFLPISPTGKQFDFIIVTGDAYVDHPSFGASIIGRVLESFGYSVAMLAQPDWKTAKDFIRFGEPRLAFLVTSGNVDSMVNHYTVNLHKRKTDAYSPGGVTGLRPNRAVIVYSNKIREVYKHANIIIGGLEASLRRFAHYDFWDNKVRRSVLLDSSADLLVYGMGERQIIEIADALRSGLNINDLTFINGTVFKTKDISFLDSHIILPNFKSIKEPTSNGKKAYAHSFMIKYDNNNILVEDYGNIYIVQNRPAKPLCESELDRVYSLPYTRQYHPVYEPIGGVPALEEVKFSITSTRGCFGGCNFCALHFHQGKEIVSRSHKSIIQEAVSLTHFSDFKGYIHDVGGPTANFRKNPCDKLCNKRRCLVPKPCPNLKCSHDDFLILLKKLREIPNIKKVFIRSGIRFDYILHDPRGNIFLKEICKHHISGRLKIAPEHVSDKVLEKMGKPSFDLYKNFCDIYASTNKSLGKEQYIVPYLMSSHPGCTINDAIALAEFLQRENIRPEQVQDFYPTPATMSTCMYYTGLDPRTMKKVFCAKSKHDKTSQRALMQYHLPVNKKIVRDILIKAGRKDLINKFRVF